MCTLKPPFDAQSLHFLAAKIVKGQQPPIPHVYSSGVKKLVSECLNVSSARRPKINEILKSQTLQTRIKSFLTSTQFCNEFGHTQIHNFNLFNIPKGYEDKQSLEKERKNSENIEINNVQINHPQKKFSDISNVKNNINDNKKELLFNNRPSSEIRQRKESDLLTRPNSQLNNQNNQRKTPVSEVRKLSNASPRFGVQKNTNL